MRLVGFEQPRSFPEIGCGWIGELARRMIRRVGNTPIGGRVSRVGGLGKGRGLCRF